jgi:hypothetical protein
MHYIIDSHDVVCNNSCIETFNAGDNMSINTLVSTQLRSERTNETEITVGDTVQAITGTGMMADCFPPVQFVVAKINKKSFKTECGKTIPLINLR